MSQEKADPLSTNGGTVKELSTTDEQGCYFICDVQGAIAHIETRLWGRRTAFLAMFTREQDALDVLYEMEKMGSTGQEIRQIEPRFTATMAAR